MNLDMELIGNRIKNRRKELKLTQVNIKAMTGISSGNMSEIENGNRLPSAGALMQLANALQCSVDWILTGNSPVSENVSFSETGEAKELLEIFHILEKEDQYELLEIAQLKLKKKIKRDAKSSSFNNSDASKNALNDGTVSA